MSPASMNRTSDVPRTFFLLLKIHSKSSENTVKRLLQDIQGVQSVVMNRKQGIVTITGIVDPSTITSMLENYGVKAELLGEQVFRAKNGGNEQISAESEVVAERFDDQRTVEQIQKLSALKNLKAIEVNRSKDAKTIKIIFDSGQKDTREKNEENGRTMANSTEKIPDRYGTVIGTPYTASAPCCGGHRHGLCHPMGSSMCPLHNYSLNWPPPAACGCTSHVGLPPQSDSGGSPSAPPLPSYYDPPTPPRSSYVQNSYPSMFSDENVNACVIM